MVARPPILLISLVMISLQDDARSSFFAPILVSSPLSYSINTYAHRTGLHPQLPFHVLSFTDSNYHQWLCVALACPIHLFGKVPRYICLVTISPRISCLLLLPFLLFPNKECNDVWHHLFSHWIRSCNHPSTKILHISLIINIQWQQWPSVTQDMHDGLCSLFWNLAIVYIYFLRKFCNTIESLPWKSNHQSLAVKDLISLTRLLPYVVHDLAQPIWLHRECHEVQATYLESKSRKNRLYDAEHHCLWSIFYLDLPSTTFFRCTHCHSFDHATFIDMGIFHDVLSIVNLSSWYWCFCKCFQDLIRCSFRCPIRNSTINFFLLLNTVCICLIFFSNLYTQNENIISLVILSTYQIITTNHSHKTLVDTVTIPTNNHVLSILAWISVCWHNTCNSGSWRLSDLYPSFQFLIHM